MGVFDFLFRKPPNRRPRRSYMASRPGQPGSTPHHRQTRYSTTHYKQRTKTIVHPNQVSTLQLDRKQNNYDPRYKGSMKYIKKPDNASNDDVVDFYRKSKQNQNSDDYTRLCRLETKIDHLIVRHTEISDELQSIHLDLNSIRKQFQEEFHEDIRDHKVKYIVEIGERIMAKLESFKIDNDDNQNDNQEHNQKPELDEQQSKNKENNDSIPIIPPKSKSPQEQQPPPRPVSKLPSTGSTGSKVNEKPVDTGKFDHVPNNLNDMSAPHPATKETVSIYTLARAKYAIVRDDEENGETAQYKSTPSLMSTPKSSTMLVEQTMDDTFASRRFSPVQQQAAGRKPPLYVNMTISMNSDHPLIEYCFRQIDLLRPRILAYRSEHKFRVYNELNDKIAQLLNKLETLDCSKDAVFEQDKQVALVELHSLSGRLERSIECRDPECCICNSHIYKQEISV